MLCAALAQGTTRLAGLFGGEDIEAAIGWLGGLGVCGAEGQFPAGDLLVQGAALQWPASGSRLELGESGTLARFATAVVALCPRAGSVLELAPRGSLAKRSSPALFRALRDAGATLDLLSKDPSAGWPVRITAAARLPEVRLVNPTSSQEASALLIALASRADESSLVVDGELPSRPYLDLTLAVLAQFGVQVVESQQSGRLVFQVRGPLVSPGALQVEPDASAAAVALAAACLSGGAVEVPGLGHLSGSRQGDLRIVDYLRRAGCDAEQAAQLLRASGAPNRPFDFDLTGEPDLAPVLAAVAAYVVWHAPAEVAGAAPTCHLRGLETLPGKESSRIEVLAGGLSQLGFDVRHDERSLEIARGTAPERNADEPVFLDPVADHRMAFCFALCSLFVPNVFVLQPSCTQKSWPTFWHDLRDSGARLESA